MKIPFKNCFLSSINYRTNYIVSNIIDSSQLLSIIKDIDSKSFYLGGYIYENNSY